MRGQLGLLPPHTDGTEHSLDGETANHELHSQGLRQLAAAQLGDWRHKLLKGEGLFMPSGDEEVKVQDGNIPVPSHMSHKEVRHA